MDPSQSNTDSSGPTDNSNKSRTDSQSNEELQSLKQRINKILNQTEFDLNNGEYVYKEHCNELRRQVQLAKETQIQKIEEITDKLMIEIDKFEKESLETVSKVNKEQLVNKLNEMKQENEKWNERIDEFKVDNEMLNQLRDSLSKIAVERDNFNCLLHNKMMKFKDYKDQSFVGELSQVTLDSIDEMNIRKHLEELEKSYFFALSFLIKHGKILSNGDLFLCGKMVRDVNSYNCHDVVLAVFDLNKDFKLKKIKQLCVDYQSMATFSDKICLTYKIKDISERYRAREETEDDKEYEETNDEADDYMVLILNENLEKLHRFKMHEMVLIGANDSFLFFMNDSKHKDGKLSFYTWSMEYVKTIGQSNDPNLPFYFSFNPFRLKFFNMFGRYYYFYRSLLIIVDEETDILLDEIEALDFFLDHNYNIILSYKNSIQYLSFNGDFLKEIQTGKDRKYIFFLSNNDKRWYGHNDNEKGGHENTNNKRRLFFSNIYNENTHEVI